MAEAALKEPEADISALVETNPVMVLTDIKTYEQFYASIKAKIAASEPDVSTETGRKKIKSLAYQITRSKTAIDEAGKSRTEEWRKLTNQVNAQRKRVRNGRHFCQPSPGRGVPVAEAEGAPRTTASVKPFAFVGPGPGAD
jgi:hypothetical protein